ncbi:class I SAM-dependent methyltransferase [Pseudomonas sp.]|uniref:class I SAM-dependent methyltransferase n=1 Tax=Pseudomonas sp. TaxID=306 RepID=UPI003C774D02
MSVRLARQYPALLALLAQLLATLLIAVLVYLAAHFSTWRPSVLAAGLAQGVLAAGLARGLGLSRWWCALNLLFAPALLLASGSALPSWVFLAGFVLLLLLNWNSVSERVPLYLTAAPARRELRGLLEQQPAEFRFVDLGCGPAGTLLNLARQFPQAQFVGVETAPLSFALAWLRALPVRNCQIRYENLWRCDLAAFDVVYCFLSPAPMAELWAKARGQMPAGSWLLSNTFEVPGVPADEQIELHDWRKSRLLLWRMPG